MDVELAATESVKVLRRAHIGHGVLGILSLASIEATNRNR